MKDDFIRRVLVSAAKHDNTDDLHWNTDLEFYIICNDVFFWGCADAEGLTPETVEEWERAMEDADRVGGFAYGGILYCARMRKMRPQGAYYDHIIVRELWPLFDACGERRAVGMGNPKEHPDFRENINA